MSRGEKTFFAIYSAALVIVFSGLGFYMSSHPETPIPSPAEWLAWPGTFLALVTVGVHSGHLFTAIAIESVLFFFFVPFFVWRLARRLARMFSGQPHDEQTL